MRTALSARLFLVALVAVVALAGCRSGSPLANRYNNFRAYYNTYYNASQSLEAGESALERSAVTVDRNRLVAVFPSTSTSPQSGPFQEAIDKSAELLRNRPTSKWADDALLVIGKAYFYQRNFVGAEQKFRETMAAAEVVEDRRLGDEARFWLGRTYASADRFDEGVAVLEEGLAGDDGDRRWRARMQLALGELYARAGRWNEAAETLQAGAPAEGDADVSARAYVLLGQVEEHAERWDEAAQAYAEALRRRPAYELGYAAQVGRALVLGMEAGQTDEAVAAIRAMRSDDKNYDRRGELALIEAQLRTAQGDDPRALALYRSVLYDPDMNGQAVKGEAYYRLAEFYRDRSGDYVRASAHFDTAATALRAPTSEVRPARRAILDVADEAKTYSALAGTARSIAEADSLLALGDLTDEAFEARIAGIETERRRVYVEEQRRLQQARTEQAFSGGGLESPLSGGLGPSPATPAAPAVVAGSGFLSFRLPASIQAGLISFEQSWGDRPLVPNWRRRSAIQAGDVAAARGVVGTEVNGGLGINEGPPPLDLSQIPRTPAKRAELVTQLAGLRYELANAFFLSLGRADTAGALYRTILSDTPDLPVAVRARYALAEIERAAGREDVARPLYQRVAEDDSSALGRASRLRLGVEVEEAEAEAAPTSAAYDAVRADWVGGDPLGAATAYVALGDAEPDEPEAPREFLAAAVSYVEWAGTDSLALARPLPDSLVSGTLFVVADSVARAQYQAWVPARRASLANEAAAAAARATADSLAAATPSPAEEPGAPPAGPADVLPAPDDALPDPAPAPPPVAEPRDDQPAVKQIPGRDRPRPVRTPGAPPPGAPRPTPPAPTGAAAGVAGATASATLAPPLPVPDSTSFTLRHHLVALAARYPGTPYALRAEALVAGLPALAQPALPGLTPTDSVTAPASPPVASDSVAAPVPPVPPDSTTASPAEPVAEAGDNGVLDGAAAPTWGVSAVEVGLRTGGPIDPSRGGYSLRVRTLSIADEGAQVTGVLQEAGYRAAVLRDVTSGAFVIVIGQFEDPVTVNAARDEMPAWARLRGEVVTLSGFERVPEPGVVDDAP